MAIRAEVVRANHKEIDMDETTQIEAASTNGHATPEAKAKVPEAKEPKPRKLKKAAETITLGDLAQAYLKALEAEGKSDGTLFSYRLEIRTALTALGEETKLADLTARKVGNFFASDKVTKTRTGRAKSPLSIAKTQRVLRQALEFAEEQGLVAEAPLPKAE